MKWLEALLGWIGIVLICTTVLILGSAAHGCGLPPLPPLGCSAPQPICLCDEYGCRWVFVCER